MKRRGFIATLLGAFAAPALPLPAAVERKVTFWGTSLDARFHRYQIAKDWPRDQRRMDFITKGEITGFRYGTNLFVGHLWHELDRPHKIGDVVLVRKPVTFIPRPTGVDWFPQDLNPTEAITFTPEFLKTNGFRMPTAAEQYRAGCLKTSGWGPSDWTLNPGDIVTLSPGGLFTVLGTNVENPVGR